MKFSTCLLSVFVLFIIGMIGFANALALFIVGCFYVVALKVLAKGFHRA